ncbi:bifunctional glutamate N-acetyltransferase/amino-acid acetyltransferase ArgJ [Porticoccaceae bacterium]|jgi:glutamate N-acetyltransferase/amino-acid N-acetyltransferase|nr:bifunctional glutamate N-acetyltransferase/amino-acid acetyltransferase ArgJ [Porticoccaceae bacterium]
MATGKNTFPTMHPVAGFQLGTTSAGIKVAGRKDIVVMKIAEGSSVAGVFTQNRFCAAPVTIAKQHMQQTTPSYFLINTGNANAGTGEQGMADSLSCCQAVADTAKVAPHEVLPYSTGVIGEPLPVDLICNAVPAALNQLSDKGWADAAEGILTTDTRPKGASIKFDINGSPVTITGICKGSGMIKPNMATMLGYVATDAAIDEELLHAALQKANGKSFNRITVDGDTSTNDAVMLVATGSSGVQIDEANFELFLEQLTAIFTELAQSIIRDGEGANKFVTVTVDSAENIQEALAVAYAVAESPLVKTALTASDPNWGRILAAVGRADVSDLDVSKIQISLNSVLIAENGGRASSYTEAKGQQAMQAEDIEILIQLNRGQVSETLWTTDLSYEYVRINAEYRT